MTSALVWPLLTAALEGVSSARFELQSKVTDYLVHRPNSLADANSFKIYLKYIYIYLLVLKKDNCATL